MTKLKALTQVDVSLRDERSLRRLDFGEIANHAADEAGTNDDLSARSHEVHMRHLVACDDLLRVIGLDRVDAKSEGPAPGALMQTVFYDRADNALGWVRTEANERHHPRFLITVRSGIGDVPSGPEP